MILLESGPDSRVEDHPAGQCEESTNKAKAQLGAILKIFIWTNLVELLIRKPTETDGNRKPAFHIIM